MIARVLPILAALGLLIAGSGLAAQNPPLPNQESFLSETRKHLQTDSTLQSSYVYTETRRELKRLARNSSKELARQEHELQKARRESSEFSGYRKYSVDTLEGFRPK